MLDNVVLDVTIGLVFIYCIYSLFATIINEIIASALSLRARKLVFALKRMLTDDNRSPLKDQLFSGFLNHPLTKYMSSGTLWKNPSYITSENFSKSLIDVLKGFDISDKTETIKIIREKLTALGKKSNNEDWQSDTAKLLNSFLNDAEDDLGKYKESLEKWINDMMDRTSGWYKRQSQMIVLSIGFILALAFNVNTIEIVNRLAKDKSAREQIVNISENYVQHRQAYLDTSSTSQRLDSLVLLAESIYKSDIQPSNELLGLGWTSWKNPPGGLPLSIIGCFITALAISLGAPFWFDLLNLLMKLRGTGNKPEDKKTSDKKV